jgi:hypothetical protein
MKKVICIEKFLDLEEYLGVEKLEMGKVYLLKNNLSFLPTAMIKNLDGSLVGFYPKEYFMDLEEFRDNQIDKILILENN